MKKIIIHNKYISIRKLPANLEIKDTPIFKNELKKNIPENHILEVNNAFIIDKTILVNINVLDKYTSLTKLSSFHKFKIVIKKYILKEKKIKNGIWITDNQSYGYFHWFLDCLPRLLNALKVEAENNYVVVLDEELSKISFIIESLKILGCNYVIKEKKINIKFETLLISSHCAPTGNYNEVSLNELRSIFLSTLKFSNIKSKKWIYISRSQANRRKAINEKELILELINLGIEIHYFENYTLENQIRISSQAECIISIHGASLSNILFMESNTHVIELRNKIDNHSNCYFSLASALNINYHYVLNESENNIPHLASLNIDINKLVSYIKSLKENIKTTYFLI
jgi:capsular polysaccharide biosynthesis protein